MRALPVQPEPLWRTDFRQRIAVSLWFLPTIFAAAAIVAANLTIWLDARVDAPIGVRPDLVSDPGSAATFAGAIAAATLAFVAVVFATTLVAIQLAASQYSPRTVRIFIRSRVTRVTLGLFLATFVFSVIILVSNRASVTSAKQFAPVVSVTTLLALTVATVFGFVAYLHGVVRLMRVQYLLETIATESRRAIEENFPPASAYVDAEPPWPDPSPRRLCYTGTSRGRHGHRPARPGRIVPAEAVLARADRRGRRVPGSRHPRCAGARRGPARPRCHQVFPHPRRTHLRARSGVRLPAACGCRDPRAVSGRQRSHDRGPGHRSHQRPSGHHGQPARPDRPAGGFQRHGQGQAEAAELRRPAGARADRGHPLRRRRASGGPAPSRDVR